MPSTCFFLCLYVCFDSIQCQHGRVCMNARVHACEYIVLLYLFVMEIAKSWLNIDIIENPSTHCQHRAQFSAAEISIRKGFCIVVIVCFFQISFHFRSNHTHVNIVLSTCEIVHRRKRTNNLTFFPFLSFPFYFYLLDTCFTCCSYWFHIKNELRKNIQPFLPHCMQWCMYDFSKKIAYSQNVFFHLVFFFALTRHCCCKTKYKILLVSHRRIFISFSEHLFPKCLITICEPKELIEWYEFLAACNYYGAPGFRIA